MSDKLKVIKSNVTREINWENVRKVIIDGLPPGTRPTKKLIHHIHNLVDNCYIHGFGVYSAGLIFTDSVWYILVESTSFVTPWGQPIHNVTLSQLMAAKPTASPKS